MSTIVFGGTGLCGSSFLNVAAASSALDKIFAFTRRPLKSVPSGVENVVGDSAEWPSKLGELSSSSSSSPEIVFSSLSTTKAAAGSFEAQYAIDHDLNIELAKAAKAQGAKTFILVSSTGARSDSFLPYLRLKGDCERDIIALEFEKTIIIRPGPLLGDRDNVHKGFGNSLGTMVGGWVYNTPFAGLVGTPCFGDDVAKVGLDAALNQEKGVHIIGGSELVARAQKL